MDKRLPKIRKDISFFLSSEEAKVTKRKSAKLGLGVISLFFILQAVNDAFADHTSSLDNPGGRGAHNSSLASHSSGCGFHISGW